MGAYSTVPGLEPSARGTQFPSSRIDPLQYDRPCVNASTEDLICETVQSEADYCYRPFRSVWFSMALHDGSAFKLCMANAAMFLDKVHHPESFQYERSAETLKYYGQCVGEVTHRLADPVDCTSEGLVTTVLGLICHDVCS